MVHRTAKSEENYCYHDIFYEIYMRLSIHHRTEGFASTPILEPQIQVTDYSTGMKERRVRNGFARPCVALLY